MVMKVFTTKREIRDFLQNRDNEFLPKIVSVGDFFQKAIIVKDKKFIDEDLKRVYLYNAIKDVEIEKLGLNKNFLDFFKNSDLIFGFLNEVYLEEADLESVELADYYTEFSEHISLLKEIYKNYKTLLEKDGFVDRITIEEFEINEAFFENTDKIEFELLGYLSRFERKVLDKINKPIEMSFSVSRYNKPLIDKMFGDFKEGEYVIDYHSKKVLKYSPISYKLDVDVKSFSTRMSQVNFVFAAIEELVSEGVKPEKIAVILPDEGFGEYLRLFNQNNKNLNFAMGEPFTKSSIFRILKSIYEYKTDNSQISYIKCKDYLEEYENSDLFEFIQKHASDKEKKVIDEEIYKLKKLHKYLEDYKKEEVLRFVIERLSTLSFDDTRGGKITTMGVLESRGVDFEGVIVVDFNEGIVPRVSDKDFFLNTAIRKRVNLPTREEKESLQKNYYFNLFKNKKVKLSYVKNEEMDISRFAFELAIGESPNADNYYSEVLYKFNSLKVDDKNYNFEIPKVLYPTMLDTLINCPRRYYYSYVLKISNDIDQEESFGSRFHAVMEQIKDKKFKDYKEYYDFIMSSLLLNVSKKEEFFIKSEWEDKIFEFCKLDFDFLSYAQIETEVTKERPKEQFLLKAKYDRIIGDLVFDYKTSKTKTNYDESTQAEFYKYITPESKVYFWDIYSVKLVEANPDMKNLDEKLKKITNLSIPTEEEKHCYYCDYAFACKLG